jgi:flagellar hook-basal body complex protein FliE
MSIGTLDALSAYGRTMKTVSAGFDAPARPAAGAAPTGSDGQFGGLVEAMVADTASALRGAEQASIKQVAGKGDMIDVVTAIGAAENALHTVVAVRDRMVGAYNDIMRMQI